MNRPVSVGLVVLVVLAFVAGIGGSVALTATGSAAPSSAATSPVETRTGATVDAPDSSSFVLQDTQNFDSTTFEITVHENGSATWTFRHEQQFSNEDNATAARENFEAFVEAFEANETGLYERFTNQSRLLTRAGAQETGREMEATNFRRSAGVEDQFTATGVVEMTFTWEGFAVVEGDTIVAGDVFQDIYLASDQSIVMEAGGDLTFRSVEPNGEYAGNSLGAADSVRWSGEREFVDGRPRAVFDRPGDGAMGSGSNGLLAALTGDAPLWYLVVGLLVAGVGIGAVVWYRRYGPSADAPAETESEETSESAAVSAAGAEAGSVSDSEPNGTADDDSGAAPLSDDELLTDEDRVVKLIRENGGRMKQVNIVEETGWSKSKVSMLLSDMEDDGTISKLRVGRENIISLEGFEPEATKSPFDE